MMMKLYLWHIKYPFLDWKTKYPYIHGRSGTWTVNPIHWIQVSINALIDQETNIEMIYNLFNDIILFDFWWMWQKYCFTLAFQRALYVGKETYRYTYLTNIYFMSAHYPSGYFHQYFPYRLEIIYYEDELRLLPGAIPVDNIYSVFQKFRSGPKTFELTYWKRCNFG